MNSDLDSASPVLPVHALLPGLVILTLILIYALRTAQGLPARFVVFAIWMRFIFSALHQYTFPKIAAGLSMNAMFSIVVVGLGFAVIRKRLLLHSALLPIYLLMIVVLGSALANGRLMSSFDELVKYMYFLMIAVATYQALDSDRRRFGIALLLSFSPLVVFQLFSIGLGIPKIASDGSASYIGGYHHEAAFSVALAALFFVACLTREVRLSLRVGMMAVSAAGIFAANYRTTIIAILPLAILAFITISQGWLERRLRIAVMVILAVFAVGAAAYFLGVSDRFVEVREILAGNVKIIRPPESFPSADRNLMSGRAFIWSTYLYGWERSSELHHLIGFGPGGWEDFFALYAHNSFVGVLFNYGLLGEAAFVLLLGTGFVLAAKGDRAPSLLAAHFSFLLLNLATMPFWQIEGLILYGLLYGQTMSARFKPAGQWRSRPGSPAPRGRRAAYETG